MRAQAAIRQELRRHRSLSSNVAARLGFVVALVIAPPAFALDAFVEVLTPSTGVTAGSELVYPVYVGATGPGVAAVETTVALAPELQFLSVRPHRADVTCTVPPVGESGVVQCRKPSLGPGFAARVAGFDIRVAIPPLTPTGTRLRTIANVITNPVDSNPDNNVFRAVNYVAAGTEQADLTLTASASPNPALPGQTVTFTTRIENRGPDTAYGLQYSGAFDRDVEFVSFAQPEDSRCFVVVVFGGTVFNPGVSCFIPVLASGDTLTLQSAWRLPANLVSPVSYDGFVLHEASDIGTTNNNDTVTIRLGIGSGVPVPSLSHGSMSLLLLLLVLLGAIAIRFAPHRT